MSRTKPRNSRWGRGTKPTGRTCAASTRRSDLRFSGSVYHPNFMQFDIIAQGGPDWERVDQSFAGATTSNSTRHESGRVAELQCHGHVSPGTTLRRHFVRRQEHRAPGLRLLYAVNVDSQRYGGRAGYSAGPVPTSLTVTHSEEDISDVTSPSTLSENTAFFRAYTDPAFHERTEFDYTLDQFTRSEQGLPSQEGTTHFATLRDSEVFGGHKQEKLDSTFLVQPA